MKQIIDQIIALTALLVMAAFLIWASTPKAAAFTYHWNWNLQSGQNGWRENARQPSRYRRGSRKTRVRAYRRKHHERRSHQKCLASVRAVGSQWIGEKGAKGSAIKAWREEVRFDSGEKFADWVNAKNIVWGCTQSSIGDVAGQALHRCEIRATPCRMRLVEEDR